MLKRFAQQYDFGVVILAPGRKERYGKVKRPFHYIENNFLQGREFIPGVLYTKINSDTSICRVLN